MLFEHRGNLVVPATSGLAELLQEIAQEWLERFRDSNGDDAERQRVLHEAALKCAGTIHGNNPNRATGAMLACASTAQSHRPPVGWELQRPDFQR
jgi:hypothetical protein